MICSLEFSANHASLVDGTYPLTEKATFSMFLTTKFEIIMFGILDVGHTSKAKKKIVQA